MLKNDDSDFDEYDDDDDYCRRSMYVGSAMLTQLMVRALHPSTTAVSITGPRL